MSQLRYEAKQRLPPLVSTAHDDVVRGVCFESEVCCRVYALIENKLKSTMISGKSPVDIVAIGADCAEENSRSRREEKRGCFTSSCPSWPHVDPRLMIANRKDVKAR